ncbi:hypothetical protein ACJX0J_031735, partial [Zea mays]
MIIVQKNKYQLFLERIQGIIEVIMDFFFKKPIPMHYTRNVFGLGYSKNDILAELTGLIDQISFIFIKFSLDKIFLGQTDFTLKITAFFSSPPILQPERG